MRGQQNIVSRILESIVVGAVMFILVQNMLPDVILGTTFAESVLTNLFAPAVIAGVVVGLFMFFRK